MPYESDKQRRYMHAEHPGIAAKWDREQRSNGGRGSGKVARPASESRGPARSERGESNARHKLTAAQVSEIRARYLRGASETELAAWYDVDQSTISVIVNGKRW